MGKLSIPSRNVNQFVYDFSRYNYSNDKEETTTIERVKRITQNDRSDDGIKEIQLELLWNELTKEKRQKPATPTQRTNNNDKHKNKSEQKKERRAQRKKDADARKLQKKANNLDRSTSRTPKTFQRKPESAQKSMNSWSNAPSWSEVKKRSPQNLDPTIKTSPIDKLPSDPENRLKQSNSLLSVTDKLLSELQAELAIYQLQCVWNWSDGSRKLVLRQTGTSLPYETVQGKDDKEKLEILKRAYRLFTFKSNYTGEQEQRASLEKLVNFMWSTQILRYSRDKKVSLPKSIKKKSFAFTSTTSLLHKQLSWNNLSALEKANLIIMIRSRIGFAKTKEPLEAALVQPDIYEQLLKERPELAPSLLSSDNQSQSDKTAKPTKETSSSTANQQTSNVGDPNNTLSTDDELPSKAPYGPHGQAKSLELPSNTVLKTSDSSIDKMSVKANAEINATKTVQSTFRWPSTIANEADGSLPESQWPQMGMLKAVGYTVGVSGLTVSSRLKLLKNIYCEELPYVDSKAYIAEWGSPETATRLKKMAETLAALARNAKRKSANMEVAIRDWEHDLTWLKDEYYLKHKYSWVWPTSTNQDEKPHVKIIKKEPVKIYRSSREFLTEQYTNKAGELCCQVCQSALPFKLTNGEYFWEETSISKQLDSSPFSDLVLCPNHRAMYEHANESEAQLIEQITAGKVKELSLKLAGKSEKLFITSDHLKQLLPAAIKLQSEVSPYSQVSKGLMNVRNLYLYESDGYWHLTSKKRAILISRPSKNEVIEWLEGFDKLRNFSQPSNVKEQEPPAKKIKVKPLAKGPSAIRFGTTKKVTQTSSYKTGYKLCSVCNGDGGVNGGCWKCEGSGWM
ncbi:hypothetical protein ACM6UC_004509 [Vibrio parahaemolyticus]